MTTPRDVDSRSTSLSQTDWIRERPGGDTGCAFDTPYAFFHRNLANAGDLLIYFQGGGACWDWVSCAGLFDTAVMPDEVSQLRGIFDRSNPRNPFRTFATVFIPYCTGDVHVGDTIQRYGADRLARPVAHRGFRNVSAVLDWLPSHVTPGRVVVAGASAGAYGALFYAPAIARRFPSATTMLIGDSGIPLLPDYATVLDRWGARAVLGSLWGMNVVPSVADLDLERAHVRATRGGAHVLAQITSDRDAIQSAFYLVAGSPRWREATYELLADISASVPNFHSFVVAGSDHGLMRTDRFYEYGAAGVTLLDWVTALLDGHAPASVRCAVCMVP